MSNRLVGSAATLVQSSYGMSPSMARYMRAQAVAFGEQDSTMTGSQQVPSTLRTSIMHCMMDPFSWGKGVKKFRLESHLHTFLCRDDSAA